MHFVTRKLVCERLRISRKTAYLMFPTAPRAPLQDVHVLRKINAAAVGVRPVEFIPSNLLTMEEAEGRVVIDGAPIAHRRFLRWIESAKHALPHYRFSSHCIRIPADLFESWIAERFPACKTKPKEEIWA